MKERILIMEDETAIQSVLYELLTDAGYEVSLASDGLEGISLFQSQSFSLILLDIMMPKIDGYAVCEFIRKKSRIPIIMLTAMDEEEAQIRAFELQVDDYITKPFNPVEVLARVRSQLRRYTQLGSKKEEEKPNVYTVGPIVLDEEKKSVTVDGDEVALTPIEFNILRLLMKNPGRIYSSAQIYELVWKEDSLGAETSVSVHIRHLREKLEIDPSDPRYIKVVWGKGYKMEGRLT